MVTTAAPHVQTIPAAKVTRVYYGDPFKTAGRYNLKQGFHAISFDKERRIMGKEWEDRCEFASA